VCVYKRTRVQRVEEEGPTEKNKYGGEEEAKENVIIMDNALYLYMLLYVLLYIIIGVSAWFGVFRESPTKGPPQDHDWRTIRCAPAMAIMSRYGSAIGARFFIFSINPAAAHNTINDIQKFCFRIACVILPTRYIYIQLRIPPLVATVPDGYNIRILYNINAYNK